MTWQAELAAEFVTHSRESHADLVARLMHELPTSPRQVAVRRKIDADARVRVQTRLIAEARAEHATYSPLERRLGEARLNALVEELAAADPWFTSHERKHAS